VASAVRALGGSTDAEGGSALARASAEIGEAAVSGAAADGYADRADVWVNAGALLARMNFALALASGRYPHVTVSSPHWSRAPTRARPRPCSTTSSPRSSPIRPDRRTRAVLAAQLTDPQITRLSTDDRGPANTDVAKLAALVIGSPEFQRR